MKALAWLATCAAVLALVASLGSANVLQSKHDFRADKARNASPSDPREVCAFCHTPRDSGGKVAPPLWNPRAATTDFRRFSSLGTANLEDGRSAVGSVSLACLSCHDGTQAIDVALNAPQAPLEAAPQAVAPVWAGFDAAVEWIGPRSADGNLRTDHPVNIAYAGGACQDVRHDCDPGTRHGGNPDFHVAQHEVINATSTWWVDSAVGRPGFREKTDMILYTRNMGGSVGPSVECGSCHDPHEGEPRPVSFLRVNGEDSTLCLSCHLK